MTKLYTTAALILLLVAGSAYAVWWHNKTVKDAYQAGETSGANAEKVKWQTVLLDSQAKAEIEKQRIEKQLKLERKSWEDRLNALKVIPSECMHPDILRVLRESGIYTGRIPCQQLQHPDNG